MASVYFDPALGGDGSTVTDDNNATTGLGNNGHRTKFVPALSQTVVMAGTATTKAAEAAASASTASTAATTATTKAGEAAASASEAQSAANSGDSWKYLFSTATTSGPASGTIRFNNASYASTTAIYINETTNNGLIIALLIQILDDSTSTNKAKLTIRSTTTPTTFLVFNVTGAVVDNGTYNTITVSRIAGAGVFANNDPVVVSYRLTGDKGEAGTAVASSVGFTPTGDIAATDVQAAIVELDTEKAKLTGGNTFSGVQLFSDGRIAQAMLKDTGFECRIAGTLSGAQAISYADGSHQRFQVGGTITLSFTNWPPTSNNGTLLIELVNGGAFQVNFPSAINWIKSNGATTTDFSQLGITLQASGTDFILLWTRDAGTTVYGKVVR